MWVLPEYDERWERECLEQVGLMCSGFAGWEPHDVREVKLVGS